jgi:Rieske 2Fe-2S family protein
MLFPGIGIGASEDSWNLFIITPLAPDLTRVENRTKLANVSSWTYSKQAWRSHGFWRSFGGPKYSGQDAAGADDPMASGDFTAEDIYACEQQQKSLASPFLEIGPAATGESPITNHQAAILKFMAAQEALDR